MVGQFLVPIRHQTGVSHLLSYLRSHQKRNAQVSISAGTQNVQKMLDMRVDSSLPKKWKKQQINMQASRILAKLGHAKTSIACHFHHGHTFYHSFSAYMDSIYYLKVPTL